MFQVIWDHSNWPYAVVNTLPQFLLLFFVLLLVMLYVLCNLYCDKAYKIKIEIKKKLAKQDGNRSLFCSEISISIVVNNDSLQCSVHEGWNDEIM